MAWLDAASQILELVQPYVVATQPAILAQPSPSARILIERVGYVGEAAHNINDDDERILFMVFLSSEFVSLNITFILYIS